MIRFTTMTKQLAVLAAALGPLTVGVAHAGTHRDPKAEAVVDAVEKTIAPENGWSKVGGLRFTFSVLKGKEPVAEVHHTWDVRSGLYRVDWKDDDGAEKLAIFNVSAKGRVGGAYMRMTAKQRTSPASAEMTPATPPKKPVRQNSNWVEAPGPLGRKLLETGYGRFINDTYWLLMPLKMRDPGVNLDYDGEKKIDKHTYDVLKLTFDNVGLTPGDTYWVYVNRDTHLIDRWEYILEGEAGKGAADKADKKEGDKGPDTNGSGTATASDKSAPAGEKATKAPERTLWIWKEWSSFGPVKLATVKSTEDDSMSIVLKDVEVMSALPPDQFHSPVTVHPRTVAKPKALSGPVAKPKS